ncbi:MAG: hypothetical protein MK135_17825, partial [Polyangiaceae bacterium]|nr:hypothetical protein [Polyangiaceae bacterium]
MTEEASQASTAQTQQTESSPAREKNSAQDDPTPPRWFRVSAVLLTSLFGFVLFLVTFLVWAWRAGEGNELAFVLLFTELAFSVLLLTVGRSYFWKLVSWKYALLKTSWGKGLALGA